MGHRPIVATRAASAIKRDGTILGGLGVSGGSPDADQRVCEDALPPAGCRAHLPQWAGARRDGDGRGGRLQVPIAHHGSLVRPLRLLAAAG